MPSQVSFSDRLVTLMSERSMGSPTLSKRTGIPQRTIARYRAGDSEPRDTFGAPTPNAYAIAEVLGVDVGWLLERPQELAS